MLIREQERVRLICRGYDLTRYFTLIVEAALRLRQKHFVIDGEAVVLGPDGVSDLAALNSGKRHEQA
jgi:ATP-dependent DNA ligase